MNTGDIIMKSSVVLSKSRVWLIYNFVAKIFPQVKRELKDWQKMAKNIPDPRLSQQALDSIRSKAFHCQGGSIFALYPGVRQKETVHLIVAYQTMSDYLDNLVDSMEVQDELAFHQLHLAMQEALYPQAALSDYYLYYPVHDDGGYLNALVKTCQESIRNLPSYPIVQDEAIRLAELYSNLQTSKHLAAEERESKMLAWIKPHLQLYPEITTWEFAAASGSTLGIFFLFALAARSDLKIQQVLKSSQAYFPWVCGLHILLDYFIDLREDKETNQLNFVSYYESSADITKHLQKFIKKSLYFAKRLKYPKFHRSVVQGLLAMYLSDVKGQDHEIKAITKRLIQKSGLGVILLYKLCLQLRKWGVI